MLTDSRHRIQDALGPDLADRAAELQLEEPARRCRAFARRPQPFNTAKHRRHVDDSSARPFGIYRRYATTSHNQPRRHQYTSSAPVVLAPSFSADAAADHRGAAVPRQRHTVTFFIRYRQMPVTLPTTGALSARSQSCRNTAQTSTRARRQ